MRTLFTTIAIGLAAALLTGPRAASRETAQWENLFARDLADWSRTGEGKSPWRITTAGTLVCTPANDTYIPEREFFDGTMKFEYRFRPTDKKTGYKAAIWARKTLDGTGCKVSLGDDCGTLSATFQGSSDRVKSFENKPEKSPAKAIGEWNEVTVKLEGNSVNVTINGKEAASFSGSDTVRGLFALEAEGSEIEFREMKWKEGK